MSARTITGTINVQIDKYTDLKSLTGDESKVFHRLHFMDGNMSEYGYSVVGAATVTVTLHDNDKIIGDKVDSLRSEAKKIQADAVAAVTKIERKINELLAITNEAQA